MEIKLPGRPQRLADLAAVPPRLTAAVWGSEGVGKTRFILSSPRPLVLVSFDRQMDIRMWADTFDVNDVYYYALGAESREPSKLWADVKSIIQEACRSREVSCLAVDNGKTLWDVCAAATKDPNPKKGALAYGEPNLEMAHILSLPSASIAGLPSALNFVVTFPAAEEWRATYDENDRKTVAKTGRYVPYWWARTGYYVDLVAWLYRWPAIGAQAVPETAPQHDATRLSVSYWARPSKFSHAPGLVAKDLQNPSFALLWQEAFGTKPPEGTWLPPVPKLVKRA